MGKDNQIHIPTSILYFSNTIYCHITALFCYILKKGADMNLSLAIAFVSVAFIMWLVFFIFLIPLFIRFLTIPLAGFKTEYKTAFRATLIPAVTAAAVGVAVYAASDFESDFSLPIYVAVALSFKTYNYSGKIINPENGLKIGFIKGFFIAFLTEAYFIIHSASGAAASFMY